MYAGLEHRLASRLLPTPSPSALAALALLAAIVWAASSGAMPLGAEAWRGLLTGEPTHGAQVLLQLRLPRVLFAAAVGAALALAGALAQGLFRNGLADPSLLGVPSGAMAAVALIITVSQLGFGGLPQGLRPFVMPLAGLLGAWGVCLLLQGLARLLAPGMVMGLLLAGLAINALCMAVVGLCSYVASDEQLRNLTMWQLGSLASAGWWPLAVLLVALSVAAALAWRLAQGLNALALGEAVAEQIGVAVAPLRRRLVACVALLSGLAVAWCGLIGFVGLLAPHLARALVGADQRRLLPLAAWLGALLLVLADTLARTLIIPAELPVGILTALLGAPLLMLLLQRAQKSLGGGL